jgi:hypothetical protein
MSETPETGIDPSNGFTRKGTYVKNDEVNTAIVRDDTNGKQRFVSRTTMRKEK